MYMSIFRRPTTASTIIQSPSDENEKRVILIGCTGHGKGTFGNFLYNLGQPTTPGRSPLFEQSTRLNPDTQEPYCQLLEIENSPNASAARNAKWFHILDTPGLNDIGRDKDLQHMMTVVGMIGTQFDDVNSLVLVYRFNARIDAATGPALLYYRDLFAPLFRAQNVILVLTHVSSDEYELCLENETWDEIVNNHLQQCNTLMQLNDSKWNCPMVRCFFVNSKWAPSKIEKFLEQINSKETVFNKTDLLYRSYLMREQILDCISQAEKITLNTHLISLPPALDIERKSALAVINGRISELIKAVRIENNLRANQLTEVERLRTELTIIKARIAQCNAEIESLCALQKTASKCVAGDDWIKFLNAGEHSINAPCDRNSKCGGCQCRYMFKAHNASHPSGYPKDDGFTWKVLVNPDWINISKKEDRYWFYIFWLEYEGLNHNKEQIISARMHLEDLRRKENLTAVALQRKEEELNNCEVKLAEHNTNLRNLNDDKDILLPEQFSLSSVTLVLNCMKNNMETQQ